MGETLEWEKMGEHDMGTWQKWEKMTNDINKIKISSERSQKFLRDRRSRHLT